MDLKLYGIYFEEIMYTTWESEGLCTAKRPSRKSHSLPPSASSLFFVRYLHGDRSLKGDTYLS